MRREDFEFLADFLKQRSGLWLHDNKAELIERRLSLLAERSGLVSLSALIGELRAGNESLARAVSEAVAIRDTSFFRDAAAFDTFRDEIVPALIHANSAKRCLRIWCAGAATGQEPYSLAMLLDGLPQLAGWAVDIFATDASAEAITRAEAGVYTHSEVQRGLPVPLLARHFRQEGDCWRAAKTLRRQVRFGVFNLIESFAELGSFDAIFCRNVLIYFDQSMKIDILARLRQALEPDGYLVLGAAESVLGLNRGFAPVFDWPGIYVRTRRAHGRRSAATG